MKGLGQQITKEEYLRIGRVLRARFRRAGLSDADIDDLVQETFLHAQSGLNEGKFDGRSRLDTWVVGIGKKRWLKFRDRSRASMRNAPEIALDDPDERTARTELRRERADPEESLRLKQVLDSLRELPDKLREPLLLVTKGLTYKEVAVALGITTDLVTSRVHQARDKLRSLHSRPRPPMS